MRFTALEEALRKLEQRVEDESEARVASEKQLRDEVENRIMGVEKRMESEIGKQLTDAAADIGELREQLLQLSGEAAGDKGEMQVKPNGSNSPDAATLTMLWLTRRRFKK